MIRRPISFTRRSLLMAGSTALVWGSTKKTQSPLCALTAEQEEGPYYIDERVVRGNIKEGKLGVPLQLRIQLVDSRRCEPIEHAAVAIWHCDALGVYSGFAADGGGRGRFGMGPGGGNRPDGPPPGGFGPPFGPPEFGPRGFPPPDPGRDRPRRQLDAARFLRGMQFTDNRGRVEFATLYPGWYFGRAIHIHVKVYIGAQLLETTNTAGGRVCHTGQLFFPEEVTADVVKLDPYATRLQIHRTLQNEDGVFQRQHGQASMLDLAGLEKGAGFLAKATLAVDPEATPATVRPFGPGGPASRYPDRP